MPVRGACAATTPAALFVVALVIAPPAAAETYPDFESQWRNAAADDAWDPSKPAGLAQQAPLTPEYQAIFEASLKDQAAGGRGNNFRAACVLDGMPRMMSLAGPMEILIQPGLTFMMFQKAFARRIHTDGAPMPQNEPASFQGYSTGRWVDSDGEERHNLFEVETRNFKGPRVMDSTGLPLHANNETVVRERLSLDKADNNLLHNEITTIDDAFTRPWTVRKTYVRERNPGWLDYSCTRPADAVFVGPDEYRLSPDGKLMPLYATQMPPDLRYFRPAQR
jgi:hypothetical protein